MQPQNFHIFPHTRTRTTTHTYTHVPVVPRCLLAAVASPAVAAPHHAVVAVPVEAAAQSPAASARRHEDPVAPAAAAGHCLAAAALSRGRPSLWSLAVPAAAGALRCPSGLAAAVPLLLGGILVAEPRLAAGVRGLGSAPALASLWPTALAPAFGRVKKQYIKAAVIV